MAETTSSLQAPVIIGPMNGITSYDNIPIIHGTTDPGSRVEVFLDGISLCNVTSIQHDEYIDIELGTLYESPIRRGYWTCNWSQSQITNSYDTPLPEGVHNITARSIDQAGNMGPISSPVTITVDTTRTIYRLLDRPEISVMVPSVGWAWGSPLGGIWRTNDTTPTICIRVNLNVSSYPHFLSPQEVEVEIYMDGALIGTSTIYRDIITDRSGKVSGLWLFTPLVPKREGIYFIAARARDRVGNRGLFSTVGRLAIDTTAPPAPVITSPVNGTRTNVRIQSISGTGQPGSGVEIYIDDRVLRSTNPGAPPARLPVPGGGRWFAELGPISISYQTEGSHTITARALDQVGNMGPISSPVTITIDTTAPLPPVITSPANGTRTNMGVQSIAGIAEPGAKIEVFVDGILAGSTIARQDGSFNVTSPIAISNGSHTITVKARDQAGNLSPTSSPVTITIDTTAPLPPVITSPANGTRINNSTPIIQGTAEPGVRIEIFVDGTSVGTAITSQDGSWSSPVPSSTPLPNGSHTITVKARDQAGNISPRSSPSQLTVDTEAPTVSDTIPQDQASNVLINEIIKVFFSEPLDPSSFETQTSFTVTDNNGNPVAGDVSLDQDGMKASFLLRFNSSMNYSTIYTAKVSTGVRDRAGNNMNAEHSWTFTTENEPDIVPPKVVSTEPANNQKEIPITTGSIIVKFTEEMDPSTINSSTFLVYNMIDGTELGRTVFLDEDTRIANIKLDSNLEYLKDYKVTVSQHVNDLAGNAMENEYSWTFTTEEEPDIVPPQILSTYPADRASGYR